jgi:hypothetical protein
MVLSMPSVVTSAVVVCGSMAECRVLVDYDGVFSLPAGVVALCEKLGFNMDYAKETADE